MKDLVLLVADKNIHFTLRGALSRPEALQIRPIQCEFLVHVGRDGGIRKSGPEMLALQRSRYRHALLVLDFEGSGTTRPDALALEAELNERLKDNWADNAKAVAIEPEVDIWMWGTDAALQPILGWPTNQSVREWLQQRNFQLSGTGKPLRPKEALEAILRNQKLPRSSSLYERIAQAISLKNCSDNSFQRLRGHLRSWFSQP